MNVINDGRKIPKEYDNPFDNIFVYCAELICPYFYELNITPNQITTMSFISSIISFYHMYNYNLIQFGFWFILSYVFDCMDGYHARKYNMITKFGDIYDHTTDALSVIGVAYIAYLKYNLMNHLITLFCMFVFLFIGLIYISCQELMMNQEHKSGFLKYYENILPEINESTNKYIHVLKYFGTGSLMLLLVSYITYLYYCL